MQTSTNHSRQDQAGEAAAISVRALSKRFGAITAVDGLSFEVAHGSVVGFLGPNGAGKTTSLRMLLGLVQPSSGSATINGCRYSELQHPLRQVGAVLEASSFHPGRSARNHLRLQALAAEVEAPRIGEVLDLVGLGDAADRRVGGFSLGMRQRLGLAMALLPDPRILILDEPANGLDPEGVRWLRDLIQKLAARGRTVLVSSHILAEVARTVDTVVILHHGRLVVQAPLSQLTSTGPRAVRVRTPKAAALHDALLAAGHTARLRGSDWVEVGDANGEEVGLLAADRAIPIFETAADTPNLEQIFLDLTGERPTDRQPSQ